MFDKPLDRQRHADCFSIPVIACIQVWLGRGMVCRVAHLCFQSLETEPNGLF